MAIKIKNINPVKFWSKVEIKGEDECWPWVGARRTDGYGVFRSNSHLSKAHRVAYYLAHKNDPVELVIDHTCFNKWCCNPKHLQAITQVENIHRYYKEYGTQKEECKNGHLREPGKPCKLCVRESLRKWREKNRDRYREISRESYRRVREREAEAI
jgi:hypothetical protein